MGKYYIYIYIQCSDYIKLIHDLNREKSSKLLTGEHIIPGRIT